ncbi:MAG: hypothetical protein PHV43_02610 [Candidatus Colwellbacteria bacterium]|nr:hypothetical protein [Candidatus Colwellbacteria bacterium]
MSERQQELLGEICRRCGATLGELTGHLVDVPSAVVNRDLCEMQDAGLIRAARRSEWTPMRWEPTTEGILAGRSILV